MNRLISSAVIFLLGLALLFSPGTMIKTVASIIAGVILLHGILSIVEFIRRKKRGQTDVGSLISAVLSLIAGGFILSSYRLIVSIIPAVLGIIVIVSGIAKLEDALSLKKSGIPGNVPVILAAINILLGAVLLLNPFGALNFTLRIAGLMLIFSGGSDLFSQIFLANKKSDVIDVEVGRDGVYKNRRF